MELMVPFGHGDGEQNANFSSLQPTDPRPSAQEGRAHATTAA